ncbi:uncharacterized protein I206_107606 [Kwoniella pini CBS 10737]|uniref:Uncharacterized protein n=1 Tax=Kwoniella pini CBS 10737 TaxID=1296096 RepID=A0A1B9HXS0_9TREE|nr:uncharacterized protein I206_05939 [Kwoniella pini CBS 10737]OCF48072.1 hypothetical protein I206_05939 [Kwoniella pini CBS 10737]
MSTLQDETFQGEDESVTCALTFLSRQNGKKIPIAYEEFPPISSKFDLIITNTEDPDGWVGSENRTKKWLETAMTNKHDHYSFYCILTDGKQHWTGKGQCTVTDRSELLIPGEPDKTFDANIEKNSLEKLKSFTMQCQPSNSYWAVDSLGIIQKPHNTGDLQVELTFDDEEDSTTGTFINIGKEVDRHLILEYKSGSAIPLEAYKSEKQALNEELDGIFKDATFVMFSESSISIEGTAWKWK